MQRQDGFTLTELLVTTTIMLLVSGAALTTFRNALTINDSAGQLADANQNLRAGTNQLVKDLMMAGRIIGPGGIPVPTGAGVAAFKRPGPNGSSLTFNLVADDDTSLNLPDIVTGYQLGPTINGSRTDMVTIMTIDEFMPLLTSKASGTLANTETTIDPAGANLTVAGTCVWLTGDAVLDTSPINVGDLVFFKNPNGTALQTVTSKDATHIYFASGDPNDFFRFNQRNTAYSGTVLNLKSAVDLTTSFPTTTMFRALMITYYVEYDIAHPATPPRLTRKVNNFAAQALAGVVEDLDLTYDLVDRVYNPAEVQSLPTTFTFSGNTVSYNSNQIRKVNIHVGVRSEQISKPAQDYIRNHISTSVDVRSMAAVDRYR
jgi:prepilin-type N-terminal cleavage/methylation domain-containing protein